MPPLQYTPAGSAWTFTGSAGISDNGSGFTAANPDAPQGGQVALLQGPGAMSQSVTGWAEGTYVLRVQAAQRGEGNRDILDSWGRKPGHP